MDDDWDLYGVVRGCAAMMAPRVPTPALAPTPAAKDNHFPSFPSDLRPFDNDKSPFDLSDLVDDRDNPFMGLQEIYHDFLYTVDQPPPYTAATTDIPAVAPTLVVQPHQDFTEIKPPPLLNAQIQGNAACPTDLASQDAPATNPQPVRARRRKNQSPKIVREMTQEELSADLWAWRKYGQKPIKGSPHPRNYYRCSTSKGCAARKQVERNANDPETFLVSYSGEHAHPKPTQRSSLAGTTRNKYASKTGGKRKGSIKSSASAAADSSFSPATPSMEAALNDDVQMIEMDNGDDEDFSMINDLLMNDNDDMFRYFHESDESGDGCDFFWGGFMSSPPWTPPSSAGNAGTFNGGGGK